MTISHTSVFPLMQKLNQSLADLLILFSESLNVDIFFLQESSCSGNLIVEVKRYRNPTNKLSSGTKCDIDLLSAVDCDPFYKFTFKGKRQLLNPGKSGTDIKYTSQLAHFSFDKWQVSVLIL